MSVDSRFGYDTSCYALDCNFHDFGEREEKEKKKEKEKNAYRLAVSVVGESFMHFRRLSPAHTDVLGQS